MEEVKKEIIALRSKLSLRQFATVMKVTASTIHEAERTGKLSKSLAKKYSALTKKPLEFFFQ